MSTIRSFVDAKRDSLKKELQLLGSGLNPYKKYNEYKQAIRQVHDLDLLLDLISGQKYRNRSRSNPIKKFVTYRSIETNLLTNLFYKKGSSGSLTPIKEELCIYIAPSIGSTGKLGGKYNLFEKEAKTYDEGYPESRNHLMIAWSFELPPRRNASRHRDSWIEAINEIKSSLKGLSEDLQPIEQGLVWLDCTKFMLLLSKYKFEDLCDDLNLFENIQVRWNEALNKLNQLDSKVHTELQSHCRNLGFVTEGNESLGKHIESDEESTQINCPDSLNTIYYGPPGTGKTHKLKDFFNDSNSKLVTFHQSYSYEDFVQGIKPKLNTHSDSKLEFENAEGIFKRACEEAYKLALGNDYHEDTHSIELLLQDGDSDVDKRKKLFESADPYFLCIDEINRGNVSAVFGELITLIEESKRLGEEDEAVVELPYSQKKFGVPPNLYIIGTMNTADRSVEALDTALRRRFTFEEMMPKYEDFDDGATFGPVKGSDIFLGDVLRTINLRIEVLLDRDHTIGHSYLLNKTSNKEIAEAFNNQIIPLLQEYFYNDYEKIAMVLGEGFVKKTSTDSNALFNYLPQNQYDLKTDQWHIVKIDETNLAEALKKLGCIKDNTPSEST
jgi:5-methylcytosine-specific restriction endonuclease McrBC GTP-binding regulatory subunit McrB